MKFPRSHHRTPAAFAALTALFFAAGPLSAQDTTSQATPPADTSDTSGNNPAYGEYPGDSAAQDTAGVDSVSADTTSVDSASADTTAIRPTTPGHAGHDSTGLGSDSASAADSAARPGTSEETLPADNDSSFGGDSLETSAPSAGP